MMIVLGIMILVIGVIVAVYSVRMMRKQNYVEYNTVEDLKKRIEELDEENVVVAAGQKKATIIVPDEVDSDEATRVSTQKEECKVYEVRPDENIEKKVIGSKKREKDFVNTEIERIEDKEKEIQDNPIKENESFISKILKNNDEE